MKVLLVNSGYWRTGRTEERLCPLVLSLQQAGVGVEDFYLGPESVADCDGCGACEKTGCCMKEDRAAEFSRWAKAADGFCFCSPQYLIQPDLRLLHLLNRAFASAGREMRGKPVVVLLSQGSMPYAGVLTERFCRCSMPELCMTDWDHLSTASLRRDRAEELRRLGEQMASAVKAACAKRL